MPADVNSVNDEIKNEARKVWQTKTGLERIKYFVYYYKVHFLVAVGAIALIGSIIHWYATMKDSILYVTVVNGQYSDFFNYDAIIDGYAQTLEYDEKEEELIIDAGAHVDVYAKDQASQTTVQKVFMNVVAKELDVLMCDEDFMMLTRAQDVAYDLTKALPKEMLDKYQDKIVWYDFPIEEMGEEFYEEKYGGRNEAVCIEITDFALIKQSNMFEGKKAYAFIIANTENLDNSIGFLEYLDKEMVEN